MSFRRHSLPWLLLAVLVLVGLLAWLRPPMSLTPDAEHPGQGGVRKPTIRSIGPQPVHAADAPLDVVRADGKREVQSYILLVKNGVVTLDGSSRIAGDFHRRRPPQAWMPGMWCVRLLDANLKVLAEQTANAPDEVCLVGDPQNPGPDGKPQVTQFAGAGEEAVLQVRMPPHPDAKWLKVYRIGGLQRADWNTEPVGKLLAHLSLP